MSVNEKIREVLKRFTPEDIFWQIEIWLLLAAFIMFMGIWV